MPKEIHSNSFSNVDGFMVIRVISKGAILNPNPVSIVSFSFPTGDGKEGTMVKFLVVSTLEGSSNTRVGASRVMPIGIYRCRKLIVTTKSEEEEEEQEKPPRVEMEMEEEELDSLCAELERSAFIAEESNEVDESTGGFGQEEALKG